ncbi:MAG: hypothetical protein KDB21_00255 [Acidimicrobiales bacterium]|nr:hypothetical protein [Acidimicrobiales bacterium]
MDRISGLPAHPLVVHIPVALLPLAAVGVVVLIARRAWYERYRWAVLVVGAIGTLGAILAAASGESLESQIRTREGADAAREIHEHAQAGDLARTLAIVFFVALAAYVVVPWFVDRRASERDTPKLVEVLRRSWVRPALSALVALTALVSMVSIIDAGHSGASKAWEEYRDTSAVSAGR